MATRKKAEKTKKPKDESAPKTLEADTKIEHFRQNMRCELTEAEKLEKGRRVSRQLSEKALRVEAAKSATAHLKAEIKQIDAEISRLAQEINDGACYRDVEVERRFVYRTGKVIEVRMDTGAQTYERAMTGAERQLELPKAKREKKGAKPDGEPEANEASAEPPEDAAETPPESEESPDSEESTDDDEDQDESGAAAE